MILYRIRMGMGYLEEDYIGIEYMYAFSVGEDASIILRTEDYKKTITSLLRRDMKLVRASDIKKHIREDS